MFNLCWIIYWVVYSRYPKCFLLWLKHRTLFFLKVTMSFILLTVAMASGETSVDVSESEEGSRWSCLKMTWIKLSYIPLLVNISASHCESHLIDCRGGCWEKKWNNNSSDSRLLHKIIKLQLLSSVFRLKYPWQQKLRTVRLRGCTGCVC